MRQEIQPYRGCSDVYDPKTGKLARTPSITLFTASAARTMPNTRVRTFTPVTPSRFMIGIAARKETIVNVKTPIITAAVTI